MTHSNKSISRMRQRMIEDMTLRKLNPKTQSGYIRAVKKLARFLGRSPDLASAEKGKRLFDGIVDRLVTTVEKLLSEPLGTEYRDFV